jgi:DEAD/DEAH box helicase domain-containing protein
LRYWWPKSLATPTGIVTSPGFVIFANETNENEPEKHLHWKRWLRFFNVFQSLPGVLMATQSGLDGSDYSHLCVTASSAPTPQSVAEAGHSAWDPILEQAMDFLVPGIQQLIEEGIAVPDEVGFELEENGNVIAEAELVWKNKKVVLLLPEQTYGAVTWKGKGWQPVTFADDWTTKIANILNDTNAPAENGVQQ